VLLSLDRGLLQAHRSYRPLAGNLLDSGPWSTTTPGTAPQLSESPAPLRRSPSMYF